MSKLLNADIVYLQPCLCETISLKRFFSDKRRRSYLYSLCTKVLPLPGFVATGGGAGEGG